MRLIKRITKFYWKTLRSSLDYARHVGVTVGKDCSLFTHKWGTEPWLVFIGNHVTISADVTFITHDGATRVFREQERYKDVKKYGKIQIKDNSFIGANSSILPGVCIGPNAVVGACSLVTKDVPEGCVYAGVPARFICTVHDYAEKCLANNLEYDKQLYKTNKKEAVLKALEAHEAKKKQP